MRVRQFATGPGHLSAKVAAAAEELGAEVVNYTEPHCSCGHGCRPSQCRASRRHWLEVPDNGNGRQAAERIVAALAQLLKSGK